MPSRSPELRMMFARDIGIEDIEVLSMSKQNHRSHQNAIVARITPPIIVMKVHRPAVEDGSYKIVNSYHPCIGAHEKQAQAMPKTALDRRFSSAPMATLLSAVLLAASLFSAALLSK